MTTIIEYLGRELDVWYDYHFASESVGLNPSVEVYRVEYMGRNIFRLLSDDSLDILEDKIWEKYYE